MMRAAIAVSSVVLGLVLPAVAGDALPPVDAAKVAREIRPRHEVPALVCAVVAKDGSLHAIGADGVRRAGSDAAVTVDDRMHLGSCTKAFTATLAAVLVAEGRMRWDSTVGEVFADSAAGMDPAWRPVTLEQLLRHRGGAPNQADATAWRAAWACSEPPEVCRAAFVARTLETAPVKVGEYAYSNQGYAIAGRMLEIAAGGDAYEALLAARVLAPLGISRFGFGVPTKSEPASPVGHTEVRAPREIDNPNAIAPAGTLHMPLCEWAKFIAFHLGGKAPPALEGAARELPRLHAPSKEAPNEALGWKSATRPWGGQVLMHAGSNTMWYCVAWLAPEKGFAVLAATNQGGDAAEKACDDACAAMIGALARPAAPAAVPEK
jgi:CubicO group peptidase (beta-lactamase class C family)